VVTDTDCKQQMELMLHHSSLHVHGPAVPLKTLLHVKLEPTPLPYDPSRQAKEERRPLPASHAGGGLPHAIAAKARGRIHH
jgi:hypothetical protein